MQIFASTQNTNQKSIEPKHLHIISFNVPYPPDYGGVIDIYYKIKALYEEGFKVHLHCFEYGRKPAKELNKICESVHYYKRRLNKKYLFSSFPYVAITRNSEELIFNLQKDSYPVLFEGLHCCYHLSDARLKGRKKIVRMHNIEHEYYEHLARAEKNFFKRYYFNSEAKKLRRFEAILNKADHVIAIAPEDAKELVKRYKNVITINAFHPNTKVDIKNGNGTFALYHGNLGVGENNQAALYLAGQIFNDIPVPLVIAGNNPSEELKEAVNRNKNIELKSNISTEEIDNLIKNAQINILPTFQATGIKLKLLAALYNGRHCIVNSPMVVNTGMESVCSIKDSSEEMKKEIEKLFQTPFNMEEKAKREKILEKEFSNKENVRKLVLLLA